MTIIAASRVERKMIADTLVTGDENRMKIGYAVKIFQLTDGTIYGAAGDNNKCAGFLAWMRAGGIGVPDAEFFKGDESVEGIVLTPAGDILWYSGVVPDCPLGDFFAIGYGAHAFTAAHKGGASFRRSVEIACELSGVCGGQLTELRLEPPKRRRRKSAVT
jgi:hypothetical protein